LHISDVKLKEFSHKSLRNPEGMLFDVLNFWLNNDPKKSWHKLADAVEECDYRNLAKKIKNQDHREK